MTMARPGFALRSRKPDVLTCIANLSSDEVFTPPEIANKMLDNLADAWASDNDGANIWEDPTVRFLDPCTKSGVFLREITSRLTTGLKGAIPDLQDRVDHILTQQVYGIGITHLTSLMARRSVYCSKWANGPHSIAKSLTTPAGNIWFDRVEHSWSRGRCTYCGASEGAYRRGAGLETHAYAFIHSRDVTALIPGLFGGVMQFDVIIGNPPYQLNDGGGEGASAVPLYHEFVEQAKRLEPKQLVMVIPARWYSGGKGLDSFRDRMLNDGRLAEIHDYAETDIVFPGVNIRGGVCYFRWSPSHTGELRVTNYRKGDQPSTAVRPALEPGLSAFIRHNEAISILRKVRAKREETYANRVQSRNTFGIPSDFADFSRTRSDNTPVLLFRSRRGSPGDREVYISPNVIRANIELKDKVKVLVSKASPGGDEYPQAIFSTPLVAPKDSACTETYLIVDFAPSLTEAEHLVAYMQTRFFRFLVSLVKTTQNISKRSFALVPVQDLKTAWTDEMLYKKYGISEDEVAFIEKMIRPCEVGSKRD